MTKKSAPQKKRDRGSRERQRERKSIDTVRIWSVMLPRIQKEKVERLIARSVSGRAKPIPKKSGSKRALLFLEKVFP